MIIEHPRFPACYGIEKNTTSRLAPFAKCFNAANYLSVQWDSWASSYKKRQILVESSLPKSISAISVCSAPQVLEYPLEMSQLGITHLYVTFYFDNKVADSFASAGIKLIFLPTVKGSVACPRKNRLLDVRAMGRTGVTLEVSKYDAADIERIESNDGRVVFSQKEPLQRIEFDAKGDFRDKEFVTLLKDVDVLVCRARSSTQVTLLSTCLDHGVLPIIPGADIDSLSHLSANFSQILNRNWNKLYFSDEQSPTIEDAKSAFFQALPFLHSYSSNNNSLARFLIEISYALYSENSFRDVVA